ncbi:hypothetical protein RF11_13806 [Thelohanellus kitauei]|uniref:Uncharacterized protein n=1 Tax=Thelohanellus kitauei TaxID=669202 RepID=A0A0C2N5V8_THEKT|nr:hypothetical protein RF11_13806 [Thelohanellus kitauei]
MDEEVILEDESEYSSIVQEYNFQINTVSHNMEKDCVKDLSVENLFNGVQVERIIERAKVLKEQFRFFVKIPTDNNCLYRSFLFSLLVHRSRAGFKERYFLFDLKRVRYYRSDTS